MYLKPRSTVLSPTATSSRNVDYRPHPFQVTCNHLASEPCVKRHVAPVGMLARSLLGRPLHERLVWRRCRIRRGWWWSERAGRSGRQKPARVHEGGSSAGREPSADGGRARGYEGMISWKYRSSRRISARRQGNAAPAVPGHHASVRHGARVRCGR